MMGLIKKLNNWLRIKSMKKIYSYYLLFAFLLIANLNYIEAQTTFSNTGNITINDNANASPYPSTIAVSGMGSLITNVTVNIPNISHTWYDDIDIMLVAPNGARLILMSDAGGNNSGNGNRNYIFSDAGASTLLDGAEPSANGTYKPTDYETGENMGGGTATITTLSGFNNSNPNGTWSLFVLDDGSGDAGSLIGGWSITITAITPAFRTTFTAMNTGSANWCAGETRNVTVTVTNSGTSSWTDGGGQDFNIGVKWNADPDYLVRVDAQNLAPGASRTYTLTVTAPATAGSNNLRFDVVKEGDCWFGNNNGSCGPGNSAYTSSAITISSTPNPPNPYSNQNPDCGRVKILEATSTSSNILYYWQGTNASGTSTSNNANIPFFANSSGTYYVRAYNSSTGCWSSGSGSLAVTVTGPTGGSVSGGTTVCGLTSNSATLTLTGHSGNIIRWEKSVSPFTYWDPITNTTTSCTVLNVSEETRVRAVIQSAVCSATASSSFTTISVTNASTANAGIDQYRCTGTTATLAASGVGTWSVVGGSALVTTPSSPVSAVTALSSGPNVFQWSVSGTCPDFVVITRP